MAAMLLKLVVTLSNIANIYHCIQDSAKRYHFSQTAFRISAVLDYDTLPRVTTCLENLEYLEMSWNLKNKQNCHGNVMEFQENR